MPQSSTPANAVYQLIKDELELEGKPIQNMATFVATWMEPEAEKLMTENLGKNFVDKVPCDFPPRLGKRWESRTTFGTEQTCVRAVGGIPANGGGPGSVREHAGPPLQRAQGRQADRYQLRRLLRGCFSLSF
jgi:hypothetical protein